MFKRVISLVLSIVLSLTVWPAAAFAATGIPTTDKVPEGFIPIYTVEEFDKLRGDEKVILMNDISNPKPFYVWTGVLDGNGHVISDIERYVYAPLSGENSVGSFSGDSGGWILENQGEIRSAVFHGVTIEVQSNYSINLGLIGVNAGTIADCMIESARITSLFKPGKMYSVNGIAGVSNSRVGAFAGLNKGLIENCVSKATVSSDGIESKANGYLGGIAGESKGTICSCLNMGDVVLSNPSSSEFCAFGGIIGENAFSEEGAEELESPCYIIDCANMNGDLPDEHQIAGRRYGVSIQSCYSTQTGETDENGAHIIRKVDENFIRQKWPQAFGGIAEDPVIQPETQEEPEVPEEQTEPTESNETITVRLNPGKGKLPSGSKNTVTVPKDGLYDALPEPERNGYSFDGWFTRQYGGKAITAEAEEIDKSTIELYAHWRALDDPAANRNVSFHYSANDGTVKEHYFYYNNFFFYSQDEEYRYQSLLSIASLCMAMAGFSSNNNLDWSTHLEKDDWKRAENILELYDTLGFVDPMCVNYDVELTDTSDKVAFSMATKYIDDDEGGVDTVVSLVIRGGGYGGEWGSNFHLYDTPKRAVNHAAFQTAANEVKAELDAYVKKIEKKGNLKIWITGFSRGAAVSDLVGHMINVNGVGGAKRNPRNLYVYTFATPAGARVENLTDGQKDSNIYNVISPVDMVPRLAPSYWNFTRYGNTINLKTTNNKDYMARFHSYSGIRAIPITPAQQVMMDVFCETVSNLVRNPLDPTDYGIMEPGFQKLVVSKVGEKLGADPGKPQTSEGIMKAFQDVIANFQNTDLGEDITYFLGLYMDFFADRIQSVFIAHHPEYYLVRLELDMDEMDEYIAPDNMRFIVFPNPDLKNSLNLALRDMDGDVIGRMANGTVSGNGLDAEETAMGLILTIPAEDDYVLAIRSGSDELLEWSVLTYDGTTEDGPAREDYYCDIGAMEGDYTLNLPEDPEEDCILRDPEGTYIPSMTEDEGDWEDTDAGGMDFIDVNPGDWFYDYVKDVYDMGLMGGTADQIFSPQGTATRGQIVQILYNIEGQPDVSGIRVKGWYGKAATWAMEEGVVAGYSDGQFHGDDPVTREQLATILWAYEGAPQQRGTLSYADAKQVSSWAIAPLLWAKNEGIIGGKPGNLADPKGTATRAEIATTFSNYMR